jgi:hypothetical protein
MLCVGEEKRTISWWKPAKYSYFSHVWVNPSISQCCVVGIPIKKKKKKWENEMCESVKWLKG